MPKEVQTGRQSSCQHKEDAVERETWEYHSGTAMSLGNEGAKGRESEKQLGAQQLLIANQMELQRDSLKLRWHPEPSLFRPLLRNSAVERKTFH